MRVVNNVQRRCSHDLIWHGPAVNQMSSLQCFMCVRTKHDVIEPFHCMLHRAVDHLQQKVQCSTLALELATTYQRRHLSLPVSNVLTLCLAAPLSGAPSARVHASIVRMVYQFDVSDPRRCRAQKVARFRRYALETYNRVRGASSLRASLESLLRCGTFHGMAPCQRLLRCGTIGQ